MITWLPELLLLDDYNNNWNVYFEEVYSVFARDFVYSKPIYRGRRLGLKKDPEYEGKSATFWHIISEGNVESERIPDIRRCERIGWPSPVIQNSTAIEIRCWTNERKGDKRIILWLPQEDYIVVLAERSGYLLLWTAYILKYQNARDKLEREYQSYQKARGAPF